MKKLRGLVFLWFLASLAALIIPIFDLTYLHPAMIRLMALNSGRDAQRMVEVIVQRLDETAMETGSSAEPLTRQLQQIRTELGLIRVTFMRLDGSIHQSAESGFENRLGLVHLRQVLTSGRGLSRAMKGVKRQAEGPPKALELMLVTRAIEQEGLMVGALEVIYDWTDQHDRLESLIGRASLFMLLVPLAFLLIVTAVAAQALKAVRKQEEIQQELSTNKAAIEAKHQELTQLFRQIEIAKEEWQVAMDCIDDMVVLVDTDGRIRRCNEAFRRLLAVTYADILGKNWRKVLFTPDVEVVSMNPSRFQLFHKPSRQWLDLDFYPYKEHNQQTQWTVITVAVTRNRAESDTDGEIDRA